MICTFKLFYVQSFCPAWFQDVLNTVNILALTETALTLYYKYYCFCENHCNFCNVVIKRCLIQHPNLKSSLFMYLLLEFLMEVS